MIGNSADMYSFPYPSLIIGAWAGLWSTFGLHYLSNIFGKIKYYDSTGILFTVGIPAIWGNIASAIAISTLSFRYFAGPDAYYTLIQQYIPNGR